MSEIKRYTSSLPFPFSRAVRAGGFLFLSGQIPMDKDSQVVKGDIGAQTRAVMDRIGETLEMAGAGFNDIVRATVWLSDFSQFAGFNDVYKTYFKDGFPTRATVEAKLALDVGVEIEVQAWVGNQ